MRVSNFDQLPPRQPERQPTPDRSYNRETLTWTDHTWSPPKDVISDKRLYYQALFASLRHNAPPAVTARSVRRQMDVVERCRRSPLATASGK